MVTHVYNYILVPGAPNLNVIPEYSSETMHLRRLFVEIQSIVSHNSLFIINLEKTYYLKGPDHCIHTLWL